MKKKNLVLCLLISLFMFIGPVNASEAIVCKDNKLEVGQTTICDIKVLSTEEITISTSDGLKSSAVGATFKQNGSLEIEATKVGNQVVTATSSDGSNNGTFEIIVTEKATTTAKPTTTKTITTTKAKSSNSYLSSITIDGEKINGFSKSTQKYNITVSNDVTNISLDAKSEDSKSDISVDGPEILKVGENEYTIVVTAEDETTKIYKVIVIKEEKELISTKLTDIKISGYKFEFDNSSKTFYLKVKKDTDKLHISTELENEDADVNIIGNSNLKNGSVIKIEVTNEDNNKITYRIIIEKEEAKENSLVLYFVIGGILLVIIILSIIFLIKKKNNKNKKDNKTSKEDKKPIKDETKEVKKISDDTDDFDIKEEIVDNDEEEKTRVLNFSGLFEDEEELEKTKVLDSLGDEDFEEALNKTFIEEENKED